MKPIETGGALRPAVIGIAGLYLALLSLVFFLAFCNLDGRLFWGDEAETALLARNIVKFGVPKVDDGVNHISLHGDNYDARDGVWTWSPWLPDYIVAGSFAVFGQTTWAGRAPFAFIGWLSVIALGLVAWQIYRRHRVALGAMLLMGVSEVFLLHIRQCRYYSLTVLAEILLVFGIYRILDKKRTGSWFIVAALLVQFFCNYACALANVPILVVLAWRLIRRDREAFIRLVSCMAIFVLLAVPWLCFAEIWRQGSAEGREPLTHLLRFYAWQFHFHFVPWCFLLLPIGGWLCRYFGEKRDAGRVALPHGANGTVSNHQPASPPVVATSHPASIVVDLAKPGLEHRSFFASALPRFSDPITSLEYHLLGLMVLYVPILLIMPMAFSRYLLPLLPIACLLAVVWLFRYIKWTALVWVILLLQCLTNLLAVATDPFSKQYPVRSPFADVLFSSLLPYQDRLTDLLKFFGNNARPGDSLLSWDPEFPLIFYTRLKIVDGRLTPDPFHPLPKWVLPESATGVLNQKHDLPDALKSRYQKIILTVHNSTKADTMPEPETYELQTAASMAPFVVYELKPDAGSGSEGRRSRRAKRLDRIQWHRADKHLPAK